MESHSSSLVSSKKLFQLKSSAPAGMPLRLMNRKCVVLSFLGGIVVKVSVTFGDVVNGIVCCRSAGVIGVYVDLVLVEYVEVRVLLVGSGPLVML